MEYQQLLRGSLFLTFGGATKSNPGGIRVLLRPQIGFQPKEQLCYVIPTNKLADEQQVCIVIQPQDKAGISP